MNEITGALSLYLLMGQSNMAGRGTVAPMDQKTHPRIWMMSESGEWRLACEPLHTDKQEMVGVGPGFAFAKAMIAADPAMQIGLLPCAVGGTPLSRWERHGDLYEHAVMMARRASQRGEIAGMLWHQGESDALQFLTANTYGDRLTRMIHDLRNDLESPDLPVAVCTLGDFLAGRERYPAHGVINAALRKIPSALRRVTCIEASGLGHVGDALHFDSEAARELGKRYAEAMLHMR